MINEKYFYLILRLLSRLLGLGLVVFSVAYTLALLSFSSQDPSFNTVSSDDHIENLMGLFGSHIADVSFQLIGLSSFFLCLIIFSTGLKISSRFGIKSLLPKIIITPFCILCFSVFFAAIPQPSWWQFTSLGGINGQFILAKTSNIPLYTLIPLSFFFGVVAISIIIEVSLADWIFSFRYFFVSVRYLFDKFFQQRQVLVPLKSGSQDEVKRRIKIHEEPDEDSDQQIQLFKEDAVENNSDNDEESYESLKKRLKAAKSKKTSDASLNYKLPRNDLLTDRSSENKNKKSTKNLLKSSQKCWLKFWKILEFMEMRLVPKLDQL